MNGSLRTPVLAPVCSLHSASFPTLAQPAPVLQLQLLCCSFSSCAAASAPVLRLQVPFKTIAMASAATLLPRHQDIGPTTLCIDEVTRPCVSTRSHDPMYRRGQPLRGRLCVGGECLKEASVGDVRHAAVLCHGRPQQKRRCCKEHQRCPLCV